MTETTQNTPSGIAQVLAGSRKKPRTRRLWRLLIAIAVLILAGGVYAWLQGRSAKGPQYTTSTVARGDITVTVTATGNLQPINTVDVGSEISGTIASVYVDFNDKVKKGQVLAQLDTTKLQTALERSRATLAANQARVQQARATLEESRQSLARFEEVSRLSGGKVPSATELDAARAKLARALADLATAEAAANESAGAVKQGETDLGKATIRSATNGIVLKRTVEPGQTVAASLQAPVLFSLAEDLSEMELIVAVSEADVGQIKEGMPATFTVDAWPDKSFPATIRQVRYGATIVDNVVSYQTVLLVKNTDLKLRPGMTATADIKVAEHKDVLLVPNTALRFKPAEAQKKAEGGVMSMLIPRPPAPPKPQARGNGEGGRNRARVWVKTAEGIKPAPVRTLLSDGRNTEVESKTLQVGDEVVTDAVEKAK
ncbi:efflux RND transporter periplasmic adaptor subunit [Uliginosibacterium sp. 31-16]|uniref:efflux RND transporter periplasmic adaptor subunit n=1 Tax=Uliginosibacterium sp. 31-16 TaxID=3068315 RepID=UPI00273FC06B|nr:efflux RND transporter periplasmic adaptor subunit [Uliginosibacterium sp. 31-16]MDP5239315.1 efflux RND transporter periplasmic adaptor subunit [Uliginosibacterium sp. 31-16]